MFTHLIASSLLTACIGPVSNHYATQGFGKLDRLALVTLADSELAREFIAGRITKESGPSLIEREGGLVLHYKDGLILVDLRINDLSTWRLGLNALKTVSGFDSSQTFLSLNELPKTERDSLASFLKNSYPGSSPLFDRPNSVLHVKPTALFELELDGKRFTGVYDKTPQTPPPVRFYEAQMTPDLVREQDRLNSSWKQRIGKRGHVTVLIRPEPGVEQPEAVGVVLEEVGRATQQLIRQLRTEYDSLVPEIAKKFWSEGLAKVGDSFSKLSADQQERIAEQLASQFGSKQKALEALANAKITFADGGVSVGFGYTNERGEKVGAYRKITGARRTSQLQ